MSDQNTAPGEQPAPNPAPVPNAGEQPAIANHSTTLETLDQSQLGNLLFGEKREPEAAPAETPAPAATEATPAVETPPTTPAAGAQPTPENPTEPEKEESSLRRLGLGGVPMSERKQLADAAEMIRKGEATTVLEALQKMGALPIAAPASEAPAPEATPAAQEVQAPATTAELEATIADLRAQRDQADDDFNKPEVRRLTALIEDTVGLLAQARVDAVSQRQTASTYQERYIESVDAMEAKYAWATDESSPLYQLLDDKLTAAKARKDPRLSDPAFILTFADEVAEFGKPAAVAPPPAPPAVPARIIGGGVAPGHSEAHQPTAAEASALVRNASKEALAAALFGAG